MSKLTMQEIHAFISGFGDGFNRLQLNIDFKLADMPWLMAEYHYYAVGRVFGTLLPFAIVLGIGVFIGSLI